MAKRPVVPVWDWWTKRHSEYLLVVSMSSGCFALKRLSFAVKLAVNGGFCVCAVPLTVVLEGVERGLAFGLSCGKYCIIGVNFVQHRYLLRAASQREEWDAFVSTHPWGHFLQSWGWGELKAGVGWH